MHSPRFLALDVSTSPYTFPGCYPKYAITDDGGCLCHKCCGTELECITDSFPNDGWHVVAIDVNYENNDLYCDHCSTQIESAY
jgi:hypothetical protein